jgi:hypothetical protein
MVAIGYEWGSVQHPRGRDQCPDHLAHSEIAKAFVAFAGGFKGQKPYSAAPINSNVYPVEGGMEVSLLLFEVISLLPSSLFLRTGLMPLAGMSN